MGLRERRKKVPLFSLSFSLKIAHQKHGRRRQIEAVPFSFFPSFTRVVLATNFAIVCIPEVEKVELKANLFYQFGLERRSMYSIIHTGKKRLKVLNPSRTWFPPRVFSVGIQDKERPFVLKSVEIETERKVLPKTVRENELLFNHHQQWSFILTTLYRQGKIARTSLAYFLSVSLKCTYYSLSH